MPIHWPRFVEIVDAHQEFLLTSHVRPDCDALGSEIAMALVLEALGKQVVVVNSMATPDSLAFIDPEKRIKTLGLDVQPAGLDDFEVADFEVIIVLDTSSWIQLGSMADVIRASGAIKIVMDHHVGGDDMGAEMFKDTQAEAAGSIVLAAAEELGVAMTPEIATALFAAISTDTGWFRFPSADGNTYRDASRLIDAGARPHEIYNSLFEQNTLGRLKLRGRILARAETELDGRLIHTAVFEEDFQASGAVPTDTEDVVNLTLQVARTQVAVIFVQQHTGKFKISFRSRGDLDCSELARQFGGGGHEAAAGASCEGDFDSVRKKVLDAVRAAMR